MSEKAKERTRGEAPARQAGALAPAPAKRPPRPARVVERPSGTMREVVAAVNAIRTALIRAVDVLPEVASFRTLVQTSPSLRQFVERAQDVARSPRVAEPCDGRITCAFIGSSAHGKTTILDEMFPDLSRRGWLVTDVTDTTSQSLRISYAPPGDAALEDVTVSSWSTTQIKELMSHEEVVEQNDKDSVRVSYLEDGVVVDGTDATFPLADVKQFRFPNRVELLPFPEPYQVPRDRATDPKFIRSLTVKEPSEVMRTGALFGFGERQYHPLQLRAVVKDVSLYDSFDRIAEWGGSDRALEDIARLTFVDTPGLATPGSVKDEVLRHFLEKKSEHIALQLWEADELDVVIHLVLCGRSSDFASLWKSIERRCSMPDMESLEDRLILAVNGMNKYFTDPNIKEKYEDAALASQAGDQFETTLESNVLQNMSPRGRTRPARVCFLDSKAIVETLTGNDYGDAYARYRPVMERWVEPGGIGHETLSRLGLLESFKKNIDALCDPDDRGQGFLVRQLLDLVDERGPALVLRKNLVRSGVLSTLQTLGEQLEVYYDPDGTMGQEAVRDAIRACLSFLDPNDLGTIERFAVRHLDDRIAELVPRGGGERPGQDWLAVAFHRMVRLVREVSLEHAEVPGEVAQEFVRHLETQATYWVERWGYASARLAPPDRGFSNGAELAVHTLRLHAREILHQLLLEEGRPDDPGYEQSTADREAIRDLMAELSAARRRGLELCRLHGVKA